MWRKACRGFRGRLLGVSRVLQELSVIGQGSKDPKRLGDQAFRAQHDDQMRPQAPKFPLSFALECSPATAIPK